MKVYWGDVINTASLPNMCGLFSAIKHMTFDHCSREGGYNLFMRGIIDAQQ